MRRTLALTVLGLVVVATACGGPDEAPAEVRGIVLEVEGDPASVESFVIRTDEGEVLRVVPAADGDFRFPLSHLHDHRRTSQPLLMELDRSVDPPLVIAMQDVGDPAWHEGESTRPDGQDPASAEETAATEPEEPVSGSAADDKADGGEAAPPGETTTLGTEPPPPSTSATTTIPPTTTTPTTTTTIPTTTSTVTTTTTTVPTTTTTEAPGPVIEMVVIDGEIEGGARREAVGVGDTVTLRVSGNTDDEVHVHGYDLFIHLADGAGELVFEASIPGVFEIELERSHTLLVRLEVS